jgi:hypothetical protein
MIMNPAVGSRSAGIGAAGLEGLTAASGQVVSVHFIKTTATVGGQVIFPWRGRQSAEGEFASSLSWRC